MRDWTESLRMWRLWLALGHEDIRDRDRRSSIGVAWVMLSFALFVGIKVLIFGQVSTTPRVEFGLFVTIGLAQWSFINTMVLDGCNAYIHSRP